MLLGINQWCATISLFWNDVHHSSKKDLNQIKNLDFQFVILIALFLITHGDIETNPGPKGLNIFHAVTGMLTAFLHVITAYNSMQHYDKICHSQTYLDSSIDGNTLKLDGYSLIRADHCGNIKKGGVLFVL